MTTFTVTATEGGSTSVGIAMTVKVVTGQAAAQPGTVAGATSTTPSEAITPAASGSWVYGSVLGLAGTYTPLAGTSTDQDAHLPGLEMCQCRSTGTSTGGTPETIGYTATVNGISAVLAEIKAAGTLTEDASSPAPVNAVATTVSTAAFTPPAGSLLVAMVASNGGAGAATMALTDSSGLGLTWTEQVKQNGAGNGYAGIWTAAMPAPPSSAGGGALGFDAVTGFILEDW